MTVPGTACIGISSGFLAKYVIEGSSTILIQFNLQLHTQEGLATPNNDTYIRIPQDSSGF